MNFKEFYLNEQETELVPSNNVTDIKLDDFNERLKSLLQSKFAQVGKYIKELTRPASKGQRKGLLIFKPEAPRLIDQIDDKFIRFIVRDIYDHYRDITTGTIWQIHTNWLFSGDIIMELMKELNPKIKQLHDEKKKIRDEADKINMSSYDRRSKYDVYDLVKLNNPKSYFHISNPETKPLWDKLTPYLETIKKQHPRIPQGDVLRYVENNRGYDAYKYKEEIRKIIKDFLQTIPEYKQLEDEYDNIRNKEREFVSNIDNKIKEEVTKVNYPELKKQIEAMINNFVKTISSAIVNGTL